jgi:hypothetical protein
MFLKRDSLPNHVDYVQSSLKLWKESFFFINVGIFPFEMSFRDIEENFKDDPPPPLAYTNTTYSHLCKFPTGLQDIPEDALAAVGMSCRWEFPGFRPVFGVGGKGEFSIPSGFFFVYLEREVYIFFLTFSSSFFW